MVQDLQGHVSLTTPPWGLIDVPAVVIEDFDFKPGFHVHYQETVHHIKDGLPCSRICQRRQVVLVSNWLSKVEDFRMIRSK